MTSPDGITWTSQWAANTAQWTSVTFGKGMFVAVAKGGNAAIMASTDGQTWQQPAAPAAYAWQSVTYGNGTFVAVATNGGGNAKNVMTSTDGYNWTLRTAPVESSWRSVTYGNGLFVAVASDGTDRVMTSPDGITWTIRQDAADNQWTGVTYGAGLFVAVSDSGTANRSMTSPDGITWTSSTSAADNVWTSVAYGAGQFAAVSGTGSGNRVMTAAFLPAPTLSTISPNAGVPAGGTAVQLIGTGFAAGATVTIGGQACTNVAVVSATILTCTTPAGSAGAQDVVVTNPDSKAATLANGYTYATAQSYTATVNTPASPSANFTGASGVDTWNVQSDGTNLYGVSHTGIGGNTYVPGLELTCNVIATGNVCAGFPEITTDYYSWSSKPAVATYGGKVYLYVAQGTGRNGTVGSYGLLEVDPSKAGTPGFWGTYTPQYTDATRPIVGSATYMVGTRLYSFAGLNDQTDATDQLMMCWDLAGTGCNGKQRDTFTVVPSTTASSAFFGYGTWLVGSRIYLQWGYYDTTACFDTVTNAPCAGSWPVTLRGDFMRAILDPITGEPTGVCISDVTWKCFANDGSSAAVPAGFAAAFSPRLFPTPSGQMDWPILIGTREYTVSKTAWFTYVAWNGQTTGAVGKVVCFDFATSAACPGFPSPLYKDNANLYLNSSTVSTDLSGVMNIPYQLSIDPLRPTCLWANGDSGGAQIQNVDAFSGGTCGSSGQRVAVPQFTANTCSPVEYTSLKVTDTASAWTTGTVQFTDANGADVGSPLTLTPSGGSATVSLTSLSSTLVGLAAQLPQMVITLYNGATKVNDPITTDLTWTSSGTCTAPPVAPTVTAINVNSGPIAGGTSVTISGTGFVAGATVTIGGAPCTNVVVVSSTSITCDTPAGTAGAKDVVVSNPDSLVGRLSGGYTFVDPNAGPTLTAIGPTSGTTAGGTSVTLTGTGFVTGATVTVGGQTCTNVVVVSSTSITCDTPAGSAGAKDVVVTNPDTKTGSLTNGYTYVTPGVAPTLTAIGPTSGTTAGGTSVTLTGTGFVAGATVKIGGATCTNVVVVSATSITCDTPAGSAGAKDVVVTNPDSQVGTLTNGYTYVTPGPAPTLTAIGPTSGTTNGGTSVTLTGTGFVAGATVTIGGQACTNVVVVSATSITCTTPAGSAGAKDVVVTNPDSGVGTLTGGYTYVAPAAPTVTAIGPTSGTTAGGTSVTITGTGFAAGATVTIGGQACTNVVVVSATSITCTTPAGSAGAKDVVVTNPDSQGGTLTNGYTYVTPTVAPTLTAIGPASGPTAGGTSVTLTGTGFVAGATVTIGGQPCTNVVVVSSTSITCTTPAGSAGAKNVVVTNPDSKTGTLTNGYTYVAPPTLTTVGPSSGTTVGGTSITLTGTGFKAGATVTVGGQPCTNVVVVSATKITCTTPAGSAGAQDVVVTNPDSQTGTKAGGYTYVTPGPAPTLTAIGPNSGSTSGGTPVTLTGTGFVAGATVLIGGKACTNVVVVSSTSITCTTPSGTAGAKDVVVRNPDTQVGTLAGGYTYVTTPTVTYYGAKKLLTGDDLTLAYKMSPSTCTGVVTYSLDRNPITGSVGSYPLSGPTVSTIGWIPGNYTMTVAYAGNGSTCLPATGTASLYVSATAEVEGEGYYTSPIGKAKLDFEIEDPNEHYGKPEPSKFTWQVSGKWKVTGLLSMAWTKTAGVGTTTGTVTVWRWVLVGSTHKWVSQATNVPMTIWFTPTVAKTSTNPAVLATFAMSVTGYPGLGTSTRVSLASGSIRYEIESNYTVPS